MKEIVRTVYQADDGSLFENASECEKYEAEQARKAELTTYWVVRHGPDLTEGRGYSGRTYLEVFGLRDIPGTRMWVEDWCYRTWGRPIAFVQGVTAMPNWRLSDSSREDWLCPAPTSVGDSRYSPNLVSLVVGQGEQGLIEKEKQDE